MKTTKKRLFNLIIAGSITINLAIVGTLCYIASMDSKSDRYTVALTSPVLIYVPKASASPALTAATETPAAK